MSRVFSPVQWWVIGLAAAMIASVCLVHVDDVDAQLYQVVVRHMLEDGTWTRLRNLPDVYPVFREHLPFGFWPYAASAWFFGEGSLPFFAGLMTLLTVGVVGRMGLALGSPRTATLAMATLAATSTFFLYGARAKLDPPLVLFATAAALPWMHARVTAAGVATSAVLSAMAVAVKGPFGLVPLACVVAIRALVVENTLRARITMLARCAIAGAVACLPTAAFLGWNHLRGDDSWWFHYFERQVLASASGARMDGSLVLWQPFSTAAERFWPGLPLIAIVVVEAARRRATPAMKQLVATGLLALLVLCLPGRKVWNHALVAFPLLALVAGAAAETARAKALFDRLAPAARRLLPVVTIAAWGGAFAGAGEWLVREPCPVSREFSDELAAQPPGGEVVVVSSPTSWRMLSILSAELRVVPVPLKALPDDGNATFALVHAETVVAHPGAWQPVKSARDWTLYRRR